MEPPGSRFLLLSLLFSGEWIALSIGLLLITVIAVFMASGMLLIPDNLGNEQEDDKKLHFFVENRLVVNEILSFFQIILFAATIFFAYKLLEHFAVENTVLLTIATALALLVALMLFKRCGARHAQSLMPLLYYPLKTSYLLLSPLTRAVLPTDADESPDDSDADNSSLSFNVLKNIADIEVREIISSRMDIVAVDIEADFDTMYHTVTESGYTRIPVYENNIDHIKGILYIKDLLPFVNTRNFNWQILIHEAYFVSEHHKIDKLLEEMKQHKIHIAVVVDEYGTTTGIVTLEDILEEIVGDILDESDVEADESFYVRLKDNSYSFEGKTLIVDFCRVMQIEHELFDANDSETLAGLLIEQKGDFLHKGEELNIAGFKFKVESVDDRRIKRIKVTEL